jgi:hypothetical protein
MCPNASLSFHLLLSLISLGYRRGEDELRRDLNILIKTREAGGWGDGGGGGGAAAQKKLDVFTRVAADAVNMSFASFPV